MKDVVLVDSQSARVRVFREAIALYHDRFRVRRGRSSARQAARKAARPQPGEDDIRLHVFPNRAEALKFLRHEPPYEWAPRPAVVFTDLYLDHDANGASGVAIVRQLKSEPDLCGIPTVVLCSGADARELREAWEAGSNAVVNLPDEVQGMLEQVADTLEFWLEEAAP